MIGIMADSHDNLHAVRQTISIFKETGCNLVIHAGDFVAPFAARELKNLNCPVKAVFGNCDGEKEGLRKAISSFGEIKKAPMVFTHEDLNFLVTHIHVSVKTYLSSGKYNVIIFAHTHKPEVRKEKNTLLINPGETGGWVSGKSTVALLDTKTLSAEIVHL
ncbi:MAG: metallophosphoesterase [Candidatus Aminicenantes bacterium]|nr:metallophosphoesterase [Candidatus Aminicenantes bacterium]MBL7083032.1 metallophosphoesterase [Candidatus Aminicenantes bacterium]